MISRRLFLEAVAAIGILKISPPQFNFGGGVLQFYSKYGTLLTTINLTVEAVKCRITFQGSSIIKTPGTVDQYAWRYPNGTSSNGPVDGNFDMNTKILSVGSKLDINVSLTVYGSGLLPLRMIQSLTNNLGVNDVHS